MICRDKDQLIISKDILGYDEFYQDDVFKLIIDRQWCYLRFERIFPAILCSLFGWMQFSPNAIH